MVLFIILLLLLLTGALALVLKLAGPWHGGRFLPPIERAIGGQLGQYDVRHQWPLWKVDLGEVYHEAGSDDAWVREVQCSLYVGGEPQLIVAAPWLLARRKEMDLEFTEGVNAWSPPESPVAYSGRAARLVYRISDMFAQFLDNAQFRRGQLMLFGSRVELKLGREGPVRCAVDALPPRGTRRLAIAALLLGTLATAPSAPATPPQTPQEAAMDFRNARVFFYASRLVVDWASGEAVVIGKPKLEMERLTLTADRLSFRFDDERKEVVAADATGNVELVAQEEAQDSHRIRARSPQAIFDAQNEALSLVGGVQATFEGPEEGKPGTLTAQTLVVNLRQNVVSALGNPVRYEQPSTEGPERSLALRSQRIDYTFDGERLFSASGSPQLSIGEYVATGSRIVARTASGERTINRAEFEGPVAISEPSRGDRSPVARAGAATYSREAGVFVLTQNPTVTLPPDRQGEAPTVLAAESIEYRSEEKRVAAEGSPTITARQGTRLGGSRMVVYLTGKEGGLERAEVEGPVEIRREGAQQGSMVIARAGRAVYDGSTRVARLVDGPEIRLTPSAGSPEGRLTADAVEYNTQTGQLSATGQPTYVRGDTRMGAGEIAVRVDPDTQEIRGGEATGGIRVRALLKRSEGTQRLVEGTAQRADLTVGARVPEDVPGSQPGITSDRVRLTGQPEIRVTEVESGEQLAYFHNIEVIDLYVRPQGVLVDVFNQQAPTVLEVVRPKEAAP